MEPVDRCRAQRKMLRFVLAALLCAACNRGGKGISEPPPGEEAVVGTLVDGKGEPVRQARVRLYLPPAATDSAFFHAGSLKADSVRTDSEGGFHFEPVKSGDYMLEALSTDSDLAFLVRAQKKADEVLDLGKLYMSAPATLQGRLLLTGTPKALVLLRGTAHAATADDQGNFRIGETAPGRYDLEVVLERLPDGELEVIHRAAITLPPGRQSAIPWTDLRLASGWRASRAFRLNTTDSGADIRDTLLHFPVLLRLPAGGFPFDEVREDGADLRVAKPSGQELALEIERFDPGSREAVLWVAIDTLFGDSLQDFLLYWGRPEAQRASKGEDVFPHDRHFEGVWHLDSSAAGDEGGENVYLSSTGRLRHGEDFISDEGKEGLIGRGQRFDGLDDYIRLPTVGYTPPLTLSAWVKADSLPPAAGYALWGIFRNAEEPFGASLRFQGDSLIFLLGDGQGRDQAAAAGVLDPGLWTHVAAVIDGEGRVDFYRDGSRVEAQDAATRRRAVYQGVTAGISAPETPFAGALDEVRLCMTARPETWIRLCYENQRQGQTLVEWP